MAAMQWCYPGEIISGAAHPVTPEHGLLQIMREPRARSKRYLSRRENERLDNLEARGGVEPPIKVLQTFALPLGDRALCGCCMFLVTKRSLKSKQFVTRRDLTHTLNCITARAVTSLHHLLD
jgi:hypothetical protein